jgi:hypothetical protein
MRELLGIARFKFREGRREEYLRLSDQAREIVFAFELLRQHREAEGGRARRQPPT